MSLIHEALLINKEKCSMVDPVTGTDSIVGFAHGRGYGEHHHHHGLEGKDASFLVGNHTQDRVTDVAHNTNMNMGFMQANTDRLGQAIWQAVEQNGKYNLLATERNGAANQLATEKVGAAAALATEKIGAANQLAIEKTAAASQLVTEKIGAANLLANEKTAAANQLAIQQNFASLQLQACEDKAQVLAKLAECCCELKEGQANTNALILKTDADRIRDELQQCRNELLASSLRGNGNGNGPGNS